MQFHDAHKIMSGDKTQARKFKTGKQFPSYFLNSPDRIQCVMVRSGRTSSRAQVQAGRMLTIQPITQEQGSNPAIGKVLLEEIRLERLQSITVADVEAEGFYRLDDFVEHWQSVNNVAGKRWQDNPVVWVYQFRVVPF